MEEQSEISSNQHREMPKSGNTQVPTIRVLAIGHNKEKGKSSSEIAQIMHQEVPATVNLYLDGKIDSWFSKTDQSGGVVFILNVGSVEEAHKLLVALPLGQLGMMEFDLIPLGPLNPLRSLLV